MLEKKPITFQRNTLRSEAPIPWGELGKKLRLTLEEHPPPSLEAVARRMGYYPIRLSRNFPEQCAQIINRYEEYRKSSHPDPKKINSVLRAALGEQPAPSLQEVFRRLGCRSTGYYYYYNYPDLCFAIAKRFKSQRNKPFNIGTERKRLQAALVEQPPPPFSEVARRLNHNREFVRRKFPELSKAITTRYIHYRAICNKEKAERLRNEIRGAIKQITASGLYVSEARMREYIKKHLSSLGRDSLFKQALWEIKAEMSRNK